MYPSTIVPVVLDILRRRSRRALVKEPKCHHEWKLAYKSPKGEQYDCMKCGETKLD